MTFRHKPAPVPPPGFWERSEVSQALTNRDIGLAIRIFRKWTGASQTDVGMMIDLPQPHVSEIERGARKVTSIGLLERIADGLDIPRSMLGLGPRDTEKEEAQQEPIAESHQSWLATRKFLGANRGSLTKAVYKLYPESLRVEDTGILIPPAWRLERPIDLSVARLQWQEETPRPNVNGGERETRRTRPLLSTGRHYSRYHRAMRDLARPRLFDNRLCYRLLDVAPDQEGQSVHTALDLTLGQMCYFDMIDVGEALAHEAAAAAYQADGQMNSDAVKWENLPFRRLIRNPLDLTSFPLMISVSTLTVRASKGESTFFLMRRNPARVAVAGGMLSVIPTGVFQPASVLPAPESPDFDLWRNVMREYSEELLGNPEHDGGGSPIDYSREEPFRSLDEARKEGRVRIYCLGVGVDALNYVGDVLTVAIFDADVFDSIFGEMIEQNDEGEVDSEEFPFTPESIRRILDRETVAPSGAACLHLAAQHHAILT
ncbi:helix-turn-helix domain-containing protein [Micromonospora wenchangensis]|uniref:helix-turn-helix domain-containing protein n=1 Tax=Micromonospora wenchangensis TaxID=1185415 RepID=UPI00381F99AD